MMLVLASRPRAFFTVPIAPEKMQFVLLDFELNFIARSPEFRESEFR